MLEEGEDPIEAMTRELLEETGYSTRVIRLLGVTATCSSRISNSMYSFFIETGDRAQDFNEEPGVDLRSASPGELRKLILSGDIIEQTHLGVIALAMCNGLITI
jgi:ADP-ribose pyrophosphatase